LDKLCDEAREGVGLPKRPDFKPGHSLKPFKAGGPLGFL
jgi:hypothetical protein